MSKMIAPLQGIDDSSRILRTSIYIRNSLERSDGTVNDILDCIAPIVNETINNSDDDQIEVQTLQKNVEQRYGFKVPQFVLDTLLSRLAKREKINYNRDQKAYFRKTSGAVETLAKNEDSNEKIAKLELAMRDYSESKFGIPNPPHFNTWADAFLFFLHPDASEGIRSANVQGTLVADAGEIVRNIVSTFILNSEKLDAQIYGIILEVYGGILLGDFIKNVQVVGDKEEFKTLTVYYDTSILLRILGCSGKELRSANMEMHRDIQSLGCATKFFDHNESEVAIILDTIVGKYDANQEIHGETGEALARGSSEISIGQIRVLRDSFPDELGRLNIFPSKYTFENTKTQNFYQIDELDFKEKLRASTSSGYSLQNLQNDTRSMAIVMRLRGKSRSIDLATSKHVFVTSNDSLARTGRRFAVAQMGQTQRYVSPILTHSQMSTAAWISTEGKVLNSFLSRELIANCMSAQKVSADWVEGFAELISRSSELSSENTILHAVRALAREESFGNPTLLRKLNPNDLIANARAAEEQRLEEIRSHHAKEIEKAAKDFHLSGVKQANEIRRQAVTTRAEKYSRGLILAFELVMVAIFAAILIIGPGDISLRNFKSVAQGLAFLTVTIFAVADLVGWSPIRKITTPLQYWLSRRIYNFLI